MNKHPLAAQYRSTLAAIIGTVCLTGGFGCQPHDGGSVRDDQPPPPPRAVGEIVSVLRGNAAKLDRPLWSNSVTVTARFKDADDKEHVYNLDSNLLFRRPRGLRMDLRPGLGDQVMQIGSNAEDYWLWIEPELGSMWWGRHKHGGKPCAGTISVRPDQLVAALGLGGLPDHEDGLIGPARKFGKAYDILYYLRRTAMDDGMTDDDHAARHDDTARHDDAARQATPYLLDREYWVERFPPYMVRVIQFRDVIGRVSMSAFLDDYRQVWDDGPWLAHDVTIKWPIEEGRFTMKITRFRTLDASKVSPAAFARPSIDQLPGGIDRIIQTDEDCDLTGMETGTHLD